MPIYKDKIIALVQSYTQQRDQLRRSRSSFSEADTRTNFIDPFFAALGWDVNNEKALHQTLREVVRETQVAVDANTKKPDYVFKLGPERRFFAEAKKPNVNILQDANTAFQVRRYGWSAGLQVSVITNFENLIIYDTTTPPDPSDNADHSQLHKFSYTEYVTKLDQIVSLLSRNAVYSGEFDTHFSAQAEKQAHQTIDAFFLETLNTWRLALGSDLIHSYPRLDKQMMNEIVQRFI
jgi:predicted type IV restriction endonuclease